MNKCSICLSWVTSSVQRNTRSRHENRAFVLKWFSLRCFRSLDQQENYIHLSIYHHITELIYLNCLDINMIIHEMTPNSISELNTRNSLICASSWIILLYTWITCIELEIQSTWFIFPWYTVHDIWTKQRSSAKCTCKYAHCVTKPSCIFII